MTRYSGLGDPTRASSFKCVDEDRDDNQPRAPKYLDGHNYPIVPIDDRDHDYGYDGVDR